MDSTHREELQNRLVKWNQAFAQSDLDIGRTNVLKHRIDLSDPKHFKI
jgi:hypothetical protein